MGRIDEKLQSRGTRDTRGPRKSRFGRLGLVLKLAISLGLVTILLWRIDWAALSSAGRELRILFVGLAFLAFFAVAFFEVGRLRVVLSHLRIGAFGLWRMHVIGAFFGSFFPGQVGADLYKVVALRSADGGTTRIATLILLLRAYGFAILIAGAAGSTWLLRSELRNWSGLVATSTQVSFVWADHWFVLLSSLLGLSLIFLALRQRWDIASRFWALPERVWSAVALIQPAQVAWLLVLSVFILIARTMLLYFLVLAVGAPFQLGVALWVSSLATLMTLVPISFAGLGVREGSVVLLLVQFSVSYENAVLVALLGRAFIVLLSLAGGLWLLVEAVTPRRLRSSVPS